MYSNHIIFYLFINFVKTNAEITEVSGGVIHINGTDVKLMCEKKKCIIKCCTRNGHLDARNVCVRNMTTETNGFDDVPVYDKHVQKTDKNVSEVFTIVAGKYLNFSRHRAFYYGPQFNYYLTEDGTLILELPNAYNRWTTFEHTDFCLDYALSTDSGILKLEPRFKAIFDVQQNNSNVTFTICARLVSCFFLVLMLVVYCLLRELRNQQGLIIMAYAASLLGAFLMLSTLHLIVIMGNNTKAICLGFSYTIYFLLLAWFFWMNVMSFDIWITFRSIGKIRLHRPAINIYPYMLYAWGVPMLMTVGLAVVNSMDLRHMPWFISPRIDENTCFLDGGEKFLYLYCPMLILLAANWMMFLATSLRIYKMRKVQYANHQLSEMEIKSKTNITVYLKLSAVMGISWVLEVVSFFYPDLTVWSVSDYYNLLIGLVIFWVYVGKMTILRKLLVRYGVNVNSRSDEQSNNLELKERTPLKNEGSH